MSDDLNDLTDEELRDRVRTLEAGRSGGGDSPFEANPGRRPVEREYSDANERRRDLEARFNASTRGSAVRFGGGTAQVSVQELEQYQKELLGTRAASALGKSSSKPAVREAFAKMRPESW